MTKRSSLLAIYLSIHPSILSCPRHLSTEGRSFSLTANHSFICMNPFPQPLWLYYRQPIIKSVSPTYKVCNLNETLDCNHCNLCMHQLLGRSDCWCLRFWSTFASALCMSFYAANYFIFRGSLSFKTVAPVSPQKPAPSPPKTGPPRKQVADLEIKLHHNYHDSVQLKLLVLSLRISPPCSCVPTSWTRKTFLASRTPSWFSTGVMRMERESEHSGWTQMFVFVITVLPPAGDDSNMYNFHGLLVGM